MTALSKQAIFFLLLFLILFFKHPNANALGIEVRAGAGSIGLPSGDCADCGRRASTGGSYQKADVDVVFSPWARVDTYVGVEYINADNITQYFSDNYQNMNYSLDVAAVTFGFRFKPVVSDRWHLYVVLGGLTGKAYFTADFNGQPNIVPLSGNRGSEYFIVPRLGIGSVIGLSKRLGVGIEAAFTGTIPSFNMRVVNTNTGQNEVRRLNDGADMFGITLGLRYAF